jgi:F-type H+-transporting ATPase subunit delta
MAEQDFHSDAIGEVYAQALINEAQKQGILADVTEDVRGIAELLRTNADFAGYVQALTIDDDQRVASLGKIFDGRVNPLMLSLLRSLARRERLMFLRTVVQQFEVILKKMSGVQEVEVTSAAELRPEVLARLKDAVGRATGKTAELKTRIDPALIGGMTLRIEDTLIDGSVETQLEKIRQQMTAGGLSRLQKNPAAALG